MEIVVALIPMFAWGSIGLVSGKIGGSANQQTLGMTIGALIFSIVVFFVVQPVITIQMIVIGILSGLFWSVGQKSAVSWYEIFRCVCRIACFNRNAADRQYDCRCGFFS